MCNIIQVNNTRSNSNKNRSLDDAKVINVKVKYIQSKKIPKFIHKKHSLHVFLLL